MKERGRGKKAVINTGVSLLQELVVVICGFILPGLILNFYGSTYNGITTSITQFLGCAVLLRAGIGGATKAALYKPIAENDTAKINTIMSATNIFMKRIALILAIMIVGFACIYPVLVIEEFSWLFTFSLFLIIGISTFAESFFGITYLILLQADQKSYVSSFLQIITYSLNTVVAVYLIYAGASIHIVKLGSAIVFTLYPIALGIYVNKIYKLDIKVEPDYGAISQRWDAFYHQVANFVTTNTDILVLTVFSSMLEVSVYSVYNLVFNGLKKLVANLINGLEAAFGNMIATKEEEVLKSNFAIIEYLVFSIATVAYTCTALLILQFVAVYTRGVTDIEYQRPLFAFIVIIAHFCYCVRQPYQLIVQATGHYRQTKKGAMIEAVLNIVISIVCVIKFGLVGVAVGTLVATLFRTVQYAVYVSTNLIQGALYSMIKKCIVSLIECVIIVLIYSLLPLNSVENYLFWFLHGIIAFVISTIIVGGFSLVFNRIELFQFTKKLKRIFLKG